jgi:hypothetical protein
MPTAVKFYLEKLCKKVWSVGSRSITIALTSLRLFVKCCGDSMVAIALKETLDVKLESFKGDQKTLYI